MWKWVTTYASGDHNIFSDPMRKKHHLSCANELHNWFLHLIMNVIRDSSYSCVVCVWFEMLKTRLYKDDLTEINSAIEK